MGDFGCYVQERMSPPMGKSNASRKLVAAIKKHDIDRVSTALEVDLDLTGLVDGIPPLGWAVYENRPEIARLLLEAGSDVDVPQEDGTTPLQTCSSIRNEHLPDKDAVVMATLLIEHGANVMACGDKNHDCAPLPMAVMRGKKRLAALLKLHGARSFNVTMTVKNEHGTPLAGEYYYGIPSGQYAIVDVNRSGKLKMENVFPGRFLVGYEGDEQFVIINDDKSITPEELIWATE